MLADTISALDPSQYRLVAFTGGEPTLLGKKLVDLVALASGRGFRTRVVSSVHFAVRDDIAFSRLSELRRAGLDELSISWDDFHEEFVSFENVRRSVRAGKDLGIEVAISATEDRTSRWNSIRIKEELGPLANALQTICDSPLNMTGRAELELTEREKLESSHLGPCPYVLTGPTLSARGKLLACCGVVPEIPSLIIDNAFSPERLNDSMEGAQRSLLLNWLYVLGPFHLMETIAREHGLPGPRRDNIYGNCEACRRLLSDPIYMQFMQKTLESNIELVSDYLHTLDAMGFLQNGKPLQFMPA